MSTQILTAQTINDAELREAAGGFPGLFPLPIPMVMQVASVAAQCVSTYSQATSDIFSGRYR